MTVGIRHDDQVAPSIRKKLALSSLTSGGRSVDILRLRIQATEFSFFIQWISMKCSIGVSEEFN
jgi:hypothetical protein